MKSKWPDLWQGQTHMDCGADGNILTTVHTESQPAVTHEAEVNEICSQWETLWPQFKRIVTDMMRDYGQGKADWRRVTVLSICLPDEALSNQPDWGIGVVFAGSGTQWQVPFRGWKPVPGKAQASW